MTSAYLASLSAIVSGIFAFWTGTFEVIIGAMPTNLYSTIFVWSIVAVIVVGVMNVARGRNIATGRFSKRNQWTMLAAIIAVVIVVQPILIEGVYDVDALGLWSDADMLVADHVTSFSYYNTSGNYLTITSMTETADATDTGVWTVDPAPVSQDTDKKAMLGISWEDTVTISDTWNITTFDQDTSGYITAIGIRITTDDAGVSLRVKAGFTGKTDLLEGYIRTRDTGLEMIYLSQAFYDTLDEYEDIIDAGNGAFSMFLIEEDAAQLVAMTDLEIELHFFVATELADFDNYQLGAGLLNFLLALGMTASWNPLKNFGGRPRNVRRRAKVVYRRARRRRR